MTAIIAGVPFTFESALIADGGVTLTRDGIRIGFCNGWLDEETAIHEALRSIADRPDPELEPLAYLLSDQASLVPEILECGTAPILSQCGGTVDGHDPERGAADEHAYSWKTWQYLFMLAAYNQQDRFGDPLDAVADIWCTFGHSAELDAIVPFLPAADGKPVGREGLFDRWRTYLDDERRRFTDLDDRA